LQEAILANWIYQSESSRNVKSRYPRSLSEHSRKWWLPPRASETQGLHQAFMDKEIQLKERAQHSGSFPLTRVVKARYSSALQSL
jgi:hypothetical protein